MKEEFSHLMEYNVEDLDLDLEGMLTQKQNKSDQEEDKSTNDSE
jgi:hypothetical protein